MIVQILADAWQIKTIIVVDTICCNALIPFALINIRNNLRGMASLSTRKSGSDDTSSKTL